MRKLKLLIAACALLLGAGQAWAQTNLIAGWDGGDDTSSPSNFGWTSSSGATLQPRNNNGGIRMTTTYSGYKLEDGTAYSYSATSDLSSVIFWLRYNKSGESFTYTFQGLQPDCFYDFSALVGWHNNSNAPTFTVKINDGTSDLATMTKAVSTKQTLYSVSSRFKTSSTITNTTDIKIVFTCNQTGDCMEAISALSLVNVLAKDELEAAISYATRVNTTLNNSTLASAITTAQGVYDNASATQAQINEAASTLNTATVTALGSAAPADMTFVIDNPGFESSTAISANQSTNSSQDYASTGWAALSTSTSNSCGAVVAYGSSFTVNNVTAPSADNTSALGKALGISVGWNTTVAYQSSAVTLPAGSYTLTVYGYNNNSEGSNFTSKNGFITSSNNYLSTKTSFTKGTWETDVITFTLTEPTTGVFQIGGTAGNNTSTSHAKVFFDNISLAYSNPFKGAQDALQAEIDKAKLCDAKEGLANAIAAAESALANATTIEALQQALATLQAADKDAVLRYENGLTDATATAPVVTNFVVNGTFDNNDISMWSCNPEFQNKDRKTTNDNGAGNMNDSKPWWENWNGSALVNKMYQTIENIPNGTYRLDITAFVSTFNAESQYVFANNYHTALTEDAETGAAYEVYTVVTDNKIEVGLEQTAATANWMGIDNVSLRYYGPDDVINDAKNAAHKLAWLEAKAAAEAALNNTAYANVIGSEKTALQTEVGKTEPTTADGYDAAAQALTSVTAAFIAAAPAYDAYAEIRGIAVALGVGPGDAPANVASAPAATNALNVAVYSYATAALPCNITELYAPSWSEMSTSSGQHWSGDSSKEYADNWSGDANTTERTATITLPEGNYILMSAGRGSSNTVTTMSANGTTVTFASNGDVGLGINKAGAASFDPTDTEGFSNKEGQPENTGTGWEWRYIPVTLTTETSITVTQTLTRLSGNAWGSFSDFTILCDDATYAPIALDAAKAELKAVIDAAPAVPTANVGDGVFQLPAAGVSAYSDALAAAQTAYNDTYATTDNIHQAKTALEAAIEAYNALELNAPEDSKAYNIVNVSEGYNYKGNAVTFKSAANADLTGNTTSMGYNEVPGSIYPQGVTFTAVEGVTNGYTLSYTRADGTTVYVGTGSTTGLGSNDNQLRPTTDATKAVTIKVVATATEGVWNLYNTLANTNIGANGASDQGFFTTSQYNSMKLQEAVNNEVEMTVEDYYTLIVPFDTALPTGISAYTVTGIDNKVLELTTATELKANTPYIIYAATETEAAFSGLGAAYTDATYNEGLLTGVYAETAAPVGSYVLQKQGNVVGFYEVVEANTINVTANHAYLTVSEEVTPAGVRAFFFPGGTTTGISTLQMLLDGNCEFYDLNGVRTQQLQKGMNIIRTQDGTTRKIMVK